MRMSLALSLVAAGLLSAGFAPAPKPKPKTYDLTKEGVARILQDFPRDEEAVEQMYLVGLERKPTPEEVTRVLEYMRKQNQKREAAYDDLVWAITNSKEYVEKQREKGKADKPRP